MGDLFHDDVPFIFQAKVFGIMHSANRHRFMVLTKRPQRMAEFLEWYQREWLGDFAPAWPREYQHVWLGTSVEDQAAALDGIPVETGLVIASRDFVAADAAGAELFGFNMQAVRHIFVANRMGLGDGRTSAMIFPRMSLSDAIQAFTRMVYAQERVWA
jgi:protein gp37